MDIKKEYVLTDGKQAYDFKCMSELELSKESVPAGMEWVLYNPATMKDFVQPE